MKVEITDISAEEAERIAYELGRHGFEYDVDHELLYGAAWKIVGVRFMKDHDTQFLIALQVHSAEV